MTENTSSACPVCRGGLKTEGRPPQTGLAFRYECERCGKFDLAYELQHVTNWDRVRHLVSAWVQRQNKAGVKYPLVPDDHNIPADKWLLSLEHMGFPQTTYEKLDALLLAEADVVRDQPGKVVKLHLYPHLISEVAAKDLDEIKYLNELLQQLDYVDFAGSDKGFAKIKVKGWQRIGELRKNSSASDSAFIAMWFDDCTREYRKAASAAIEHCQYKPLIIDQYEFNDFIMN